MSAPLDAMVLRTATEPRRLRILELIWEREMSVGEIADNVPVSIAAVSQHLSKLRAAGLVAVRQDGRHRFYRATKEDMGTLAIILESFWGERLLALKRRAEAIQRTTDSGSGPDRKTQRKPKGSRS